MLLKSLFINGICKFKILLKLGLKAITLYFLSFILKALKMMTFVFARQSLIPVHVERQR